MQSAANFFRALLPGPVKQLLKRILGIPASRIHPDWRILDVAGRIDQPHVVLDLGARNGWFFSCWKKWCPAAIVHAFEPDVDAYNKLCAEHEGDPSIHLVQCGVGDEEGTKEFFYLGGSEVSSSILKHNPLVWEKLNYQTGKVEQRQISVVRLDDYCRKAAIELVHLIKIDIQGYELRALQGAAGILARTNYILVESGIQKLYEDASSFTQVHDFLTQNDFHLVNFRAWHRGNNVLMESDMLFRRNDLAPEIDPDSKIDRYYVGAI